MTEPHQPGGTGVVMAAVVVIYGLGPPLMKAISAPPMAVVSARTLLAVPVMLTVAHLSGRRITSTALRPTVIPGLLLGANFALVFQALPHISIAVLSVILALQPGMVLICSGPVLGEQTSRWHLGWTLVGVVGVVVVIAGADPRVRVDALGILLAVAGLSLYTAYFVMNRRVRTTTTIDPIEWMTGVTIFSSLALAPLAVVTPLEHYRRLGGTDWVYLAFVIVGVGVIGHTMMSWVHGYIAANRSSLYLLGMNVVAVVVAWPLHDEPVSPLQVVGGLVVLGAVAAVISRPTVPAAVAVPAAPSG